MPEDTLFVDSFDNCDKNYLSLHKEVCGIDEVGRGPLCGPVLSACVSLKKNIELGQLPKETQDSKKLSPSDREAIYTKLLHLVDYGIGIVPNDIIDNINILQATMMSMEIAYSQLRKLTGSSPFALIDGNKVPNRLLGNSLAIVKGDSKSKLISAASIIAKVSRDRIMIHYSKHLPQYYLANNKGYGTKSHISSILENGPSYIHRKTFLKKILES